MRSQFDPGAIRDLMNSKQGPVFQFVTDVVRRGNNAAKMECPVDTGHLRATHQYTVTADQDGVVGRFGATASYARDVHEGHTTAPARVRAGRRTATVRRNVPGNPWLVRAARRTGITVTRTGS